MMAAVAGTVTVMIGGSAWIVSTASSASASTIKETFASTGPTGPLELQVPESIDQPGNVAPGQTMTITVPSSSQPVPTTESGVAVSYIAGLHTLIPVPPNSTYVGNIVGGNWTFTPAGGGAPTTGPLTVTECTAAAPGTCTATAPNGTTFRGPGTSTPYIEATTGTAHFAAGGKLTLPAWSFDVKAASSGTIQSTVSEFDTSANITIGTTSITVAVAAYPGAVVSGCLVTGGTCTQAAYQFQPIATTAIGSTAGSSTTSSTTTSSTSSTTAAASTGSGSSSGTGTGSAGSGATVAAASAPAGGSGPAAASGLANTGPPKSMWVLGLISLGLLDLGYLFLSATWRARRARRSAGG